MGGGNGYHSRQGMDRCQQEWDAATVVQLTSVRACAPPCQCARLHTFLKQLGQAAGGGGEDSVAPEVSTQTGVGVMSWRCVTALRRGPVCSVCALSDANS